MESMKEKLTEYAQLLVRVGLNIQRGQPLVISSPVECAFFARLCAAEAYQAGCREVVMNWGDDELGRMKYLHAADEVFDTVPLWRRHFYNDYALEGAAYLAISASDPENLKGVDHSRIVRAQQASGRALKDFDRLQMCGGFPWCIASIPIPSWAKKVFPDLAESEAMDKLWEAIFQAVRITGDGRCVDKWHRHIETLAHRVEKLNQLNFKSLHYTNSLGTDLTVELPEDHIWEAGNDVTLSGRTYIANIPTEEVFTSPLKTGVNGVVYSALPLSHNGTIIDKFHFVVKDGKIVEVHAEQGEEALKAAVTVDEGASYSREQMKMFLTRLGFGSKIVITGDVTQIDMPDGKASGLKEAMRVLRDVEGIGICELTNADVVRHVMVQRIVEAYERYETAKNGGKGRK